jgi:DivIVA domain-containing protein
VPFSPNGPSGPSGLSQRDFNPQSEGYDMAEVDAFWEKIPDTSSASGNLR